MPRVSSGKDNRVPQDRSPILSCFIYDTSRSISRVLACSAPVEIR